MALIGTLTSGISALKTFSKGLEVIGNNIANVNTIGYKSSSASFADTFSNTLRSGSPGTSQVQVGTGVQIAAVTTNFGQGALSSTGKPSDLGISGAGYFVVKNGSGATYATRDGSFHFDTNNKLVNNKGYNVLDTAGVAITAAGAATAASINFGSDGTVTTYDSAGVGTVAGQIGLLKVPDESKLLKQGDNLYDFAATGATIAGNMAAAPTGGRGQIQSGVLELSNVDLTDQFSELITTQRSFQAGSRLITVSDSVLQEIVDLKRS